MSASTSEPTAVVSESDEIRDEVLLLGDVVLVGADDGWPAFVIDAQRRLDVGQHVADIAGGDAGLGDIESEDRSGAIGGAGLAEDTRRRRRWRPC